MKKFVKLSLAAAVATAGLTSANAGTLAEAFAASKVKGQIDSMYFQKELAAGGANADSSIWVNGGKLSLTTGSYNGLTAGVTFQTSHVASIDDNAAGYAGDMDASGSVMSEAYLAYTLANTTAKAGRQFISTPLVAGSGSRMIKEAFEGIVFVNTDIANTTLVAAYVDKYQKRTETGSEVGEFDSQEGALQDGAYTVYVKNTSVSDLTIQAQYAQLNQLGTAGDIKAFYADASYKLGAVTLAAQANLSDDGSTSNSDGSLYGVKASGSIGPVTLTAAYTTTDDEADVVRGLGEGAYKTFTGSGMIGAGAASYGADTDSFLVSAAGKVAGVSLKVSYAQYDDDINNSEMEETNFTAGYAFNKNLSAKVSYSAFDDYSYDNRVRTYLSYKF